MASHTDIIHLSMRKAVIGLAIGKVWHLKLIDGFIEEPLDKAHESALAGPRLANLLRHLRTAQTPWLLETVPNMVDRHEEAVFLMIIVERPEEREPPFGLAEVIGVDGNRTLSLIAWPRLCFHAGHAFHTRLSEKPSDSLDSPPVLRP
jgi:hypothetical protein